eukprot:m.30749 g.30749  ORF g.30749 m.30749 type:complete len:937 (-) comp16339_c1_seq1:466-3276(-)
MRQSRIALVVLLSVIQGHALLNVTIPVNAVNDCRAQAKYLDSTSMACVACGTNEVPTPIADGCICDNQSIVVGSTIRYLQRLDTPATSCARCISGERPSDDGLSCISCAVTGCGACPAGQFEKTRTVEGSTQSGECTSCENAYYADSDSCKPCTESSPRMNGSDSTCTCASDYVKKSDLCFLSTLPSLTTEANGVFSTATESADIKEKLEAAYHLCKENQNRTACQVLANICVLQLYSTSTSACSLYTELNLTKAQGVNGVASWPQGLPWLYYADNERPHLSTDLKLTTTLDHQATTSGTKFGKLQLVVAAYSLRGEFLGFENLTTQFQLCEPLRQSVSNAWLWFGTKFSISCKIQISNGIVDAHLAGPEPVFYDPFIVDSEDASAEETHSLVPLPVQFKGDTRYFRRLFLFDNVTGNGLFARVASKITISFQLIENGNGRINPPVVSVEYSEISMVGSSTVNADFETTYRIGLEDFEQPFETASIVAGVCAFIAAVFRTKADFARNDYAEVGSLSLARFAFEFLSLSSTALYVVLCGTSIVYMVVFKAQKTAYIIPPEEENLTVFTTVLIIATSFKVVHIVYLVYEQCTYDIFFMDWEKPKKKTKGSLWRTVLIANEYNELTTLRKVPFTSLLLLVVFFYSIVDGKSLALQNQKSDAHDYEASENKMLRFGTFAILYNSLALLLWLYYKVLFGRFISPYLGAFVDLCSVANISILTMTHTNRGFYLHGRSPHNESEVSLMEMKDLLRREQEDLTGKRGLIPQKDDQVFEVFLPPYVHRRWLQDKNSAQTRGPTSLLPVNRGQQSSNQQAAENPYERINEFLTGYFNRSYKDDIDFVVKDKTLLQQLLMDTPMVDKQGIFYPDRHFFIAETIFMGHEGSLVMFEVLVFLLVDWFSGNWVASLIATYCCASSLAVTRRHFGSKNIEDKALVDAMFLI